MNTTETHFPLHLPTPIKEVVSDVFAQQGVRLFIKRDDLSHPSYGGNKWRKLKYNLLEAKQLGFSKLLTFGGAYSNHLAATAAAGRALGFQTLGVVRGERVLPLNPTLHFATMCGMELKFVSRANYKNKNQNSLLLELNIDANSYYFVPEGGSNCLALRGVAELIPEIQTQLGRVPDFLLSACGTGATLSGLAQGLHHWKSTGEGHDPHLADTSFATKNALMPSAIGIPVLKGAFMAQAVEDLLKTCGHDTKYPQNWEIHEGYHFGGYAKYTETLIHFINSFNEQYGIPLDPVYTGKAMYAAFDLAQKGHFPKNTIVVFLHTGGLQGIAGFNQRFGELIQ